MNSNIIEMILQLVDSGKLYLIKNNREGCYQLGFSPEGEPDAENDDVVKMDVVELD